MKRLPTLAVAMLAILAACDSPSSIQDHADHAYELVLTQGVAAPAAVHAVPTRPLFSTLTDGRPSVGGSVTEPLSLNGAACTDPSEQVVRISYSVTGNQASEASFDVMTTWEYDGSTFVGSDPSTVTLPAKQGGGTATHSVDITVRNDSGSGEGASSFQVAPFNLVTNASDPGGQQLDLAASSTATIHVVFHGCDVPNTPPTLTLPTLGAVEATSAAGAEVTFEVTASDAEDGDITGSVSCTPSSGSIFDLGETTVECSVTDSGGLTTSGSFVVTVQDTTPPAFVSFPPALVTLVATDLDGRELDLAAFDITADDWNQVSNPVTVECDVAGEEVDGYQVAIGQTVTVSCTATDSSAFPGPNTSAARTFEVFVGFDLASTCGFGAPLRNAAPFSAHKQNSAIPHKVCAPAYADGTLATDLAAGLKLVVRYIGAGSPQEFDSLTDEDLSAGSTVWRWDAKDEHYIFNAKTSRSWPEGAWETEVSYAGIVLGSTNFQIRR